MLLTNAAVRVGEAAHPRASWILLRRGRIAALGEGSPPSNAAPAERTIDACSRPILPGFIDAHLHLLEGGLGLEQLDLSSITSREDFEDAIRARHDTLPPGDWLIARGWMSENWPGGAEPTRDWLHAAGDRPTVCYRMDLHAALVNDAVLEQCDLSVNAPGGRIVRDEGGKPTGLLVEAAAWKLVNPLIPPSSPEQNSAALRAAQRHLHALGVTTVGSMEYARQVESVLVPLLNDLTIRCRITLLDRDWPLELAIADRLRDRIPQHHRGQLDVIGFKAFIDGTLGSRTARLLGDYADDRGNRGLLVELARDGRLGEWAARVGEAGYSPSMHAIGDEAVRLALDAVTGISFDALPRIEHAQTIHPADLRRFKGVIASMQPLHKADDGRYALSRLGSARMERFFPFRRLIGAGATLAFGSDWPVVSPDPMRGIRAAVTGLTVRNEPCCTDQNLTIREALRAYTADAARALQLDDLGVLRPGTPADLIMLDQDPYDIDWTRSLPQVLMTIAGGDVVYDTRPECAASSATKSS